MASSRRTYDTDVITLRTVFAKSVVNSNIPALRTLTADGAGGTYWAIPSSLGQNPSFNEIITSAGTYTADLSYNRFRLLAGEGVGMVNGPAGLNQTTLFGKAFNTVDVSGENSFYAYTSNQVTPIIRVATTGTIQARSDPATNTLFLDGPVSNPYIVSTGQYGFYQIKVTPAASTITSTVQGWGGDFITANSPSTMLRFIGYNDIQLSTNVTTNSIFFTISTFTSKGYLDISAAAFSAYPSTLSTVSSLYVQQSDYNSTVQSLSSINGISFSTLQSSIYELAISTGFEFSNVWGEINARAYISQLLSEISNVNLELLSTVGGLGTAGYISTPAGGAENPTFFTVSTGSLQASSITTSSLLNYGTLSTHSVVVYGASTFTVQGLSYFENIVSSYSVLTPTLGILDVISGDPVYMTASNGSISFNGSGGGGGDILDTQIASTLQYSPEFSSIKLGYNAGFTGQGNDAIAIGKNAGYINQAPSSIVLSALGDELNANTEGFFVAPVRALFTTYDYTLGYNSTTKEVCMISNAILPRFSATTPFDTFAETGGGGNFNQMLELCNYTWNFGPGAPIDGVHTYRVHVSWGTRGFTQDVAWYLILSNITQNVAYSGVTFNTANSNFHIARTTNINGTDYTAGSYMDIIENMTISNGDIFTPLLYMGASSGSNTPAFGSKFTFSLELAKENF
jgi:hypothetical protein